MIMIIIALAAVPPLGPLLGVLCSALMCYVMLCCYVTYPPRPPLPPDALLSPSSQRYSVYVLPPATHQDSLQKRQADFEADDAREDFTARPEGRRGAPRPDAPPAGFLEVSQGPGLFGGAVREGAPFFITDFDPELQPGWGHEEELEDKMDSYAVDPTPGSSSLTISGDGLREAEDSPRHSDADKDAKVLKKLLEKPKKLMKVGAGF